MSPPRFCRVPAARSGCGPSSGESAGPAAGGRAFIAGAVRLSPVAELLIQDGPRDADERAQLLAETASAFGRDSAPNSRGRSGRKTSPTASWRPDRIQPADRAGGGGGWRRHSEGAGALISGGSGSIRSVPV